MVAVVYAQYEQQYGQYYPQPEERKWLQIPALKLKLSTDKLLFKLPKFDGLMTHREPEYQPHY